MTGYLDEVRNSKDYNNYKLTADKVIQILDNVREERTKSRRRWIWELMQNAKVNDFVVGSAITCLIMTQIAENRHLNDFFTTLLTAEGSELYMKEATNYVKPNIQTNIYELTDIAKKRGEIVMGYKKNVNQKMMIAINPNKLAEVSFEKGDCLIVLAEN